MCTFHFRNTYMDCLGQLEQMSSELLLEDFLTITWCNNCVLTNPSCCSRSRSGSNVGGDTNFSSGWQHFEWVPLFTFSKLAFHIKRVNCEHAHLVVLMWVEQILKHQQLKKAKMESSLVECKICKSRAELTLETLKWNLKEKSKQQFSAQFISNN